VKKSNTPEENKLLEVLYKEFDNGFLDDVYKIGLIVYKDGTKVIHFICSQKKIYNRDFFDRHKMGNLEGKSGFMLSSLLKTFGIKQSSLFTKLMWDNERRNSLVRWKYIK
jgi:hypothetical protein